MGDRPCGQLHSEGRLQVATDLADRHFMRIQADDHRVQPVHAPLALLDQSGRKGAGSVAGDLDLEGTNLGVDRLRAGAITGATTRRRCRPPPCHSPGGRSVRPATHAPGPS